MQIPRENIVMYNNHFQDSIESYKKALEIYEKLNDKRGQAIAHIHLGDVYLAATGLVDSGIPSIPPRIPPRPVPVPRPRVGSIEERIDNIRESIKELTIAVELSQDEDLSTQAFSLLKLGEAQVLQTIEREIEAQGVDR